MKKIQPIFKAFFLALVNLMHPRVIWLSLRPFLIVAVLWGALIWLAWTPALALLSQFLTTSRFTNWIEAGLIWVGFDSARIWIAPLFFVMLLIPLIAMSLVMLIALTTVPALIEMLSRQSSYQDLDRQQGGSVFGGIVYGIWSTFLCLCLMLITLPIWWMPPLVAVLPPLLWGWLTMRLMSYDALAKHANHDERVTLLHRYRWELLSMGVISGMLGAIPTFFWATSVFALVLFPIVSFVALWIYSLIFIFAGLWFSYFLLDALKALRDERQADSIVVESHLIDLELPYHG